ncbi:MAG: ArgE/DapE family deacylase [Nitrososphaeria archaeon]|nr:ArgE/DapE family deacylase [Nitrososphaeria archaeon]NIN52667.1 ArgE/DapE family deacylase [Nitrososphaeria archaeon]NIQ33142.1 ArgE/DapE family deacylase [Nitrososphaeria archaeon]
MDIKTPVFELIEKHRDEIVGFLKKIIQIPSVTGEEKEIQEFFAAKLQEMGLEVDVWEPREEELRRHPAYMPSKKDYRDRPNVVGTYKGSKEGRSLLFNGHVDVIPPEPLEAWSHDPWGGEIKNGKLYGRGASDMKGGLAAMTMAMDMLLRAGIKPKGDIILEYVVDEEWTGNGTLAAILKGYNAKAGISCEASDLEIQPATTGSMWFSIKVRGKTASMSRPWEAVSAVEKGYKVYQAINDLQEIRIIDKRHPLYPDPRGSLSCFVGVFQSGTFPSAPPDLCLIRGRMGVLPSEDPKEAQRELIRHVEAAAKLDPWLRKYPPEVKFVDLCAEPAEIDSDHPIVKTLVQSFGGTLNRESIIKGHDGAADTRFFNNYGQTPTVIFGPGTITQMHASDEWIRIEDLIDSVKVLASVIIDWCGREE